MCKCVSLTLNHCHKLIQATISIVFSSCHHCNLCWKTF